MISLSEYKDTIDFNQINLKEFNKNSNTLLIVNQKDESYSIFDNYFKKITYLELFNYEHPFIDNSSEKILSIGIDNSYENILFIDTFQKLHNVNIIKDLFLNKNTQGLIISPTIKKELSYELIVDRGKITYEEGLNEIQHKKFFYLDVKTCTLKNIVNKDLDIFSSNIVYKDFRGDLINKNYIFNINNELIVIPKEHQLLDYKFMPILKSNTKYLNYQYIYWKNNFTLSYKNLLSFHFRLKYLEILQKLIDGELYADF